jgi:F420-0:gamma-glutamyl ligase-like protein
MTKYYALAVATSYWKPSDNYTDKIIEDIEDKIENGDFIVTSEKAISNVWDSV